MKLLVFLGVACLACELFVFGRPLSTRWEEGDLMPFALYPNTAPSFFSSLYSYDASFSEFRPEDATKFATPDISPASPEFKISISNDFFKPRHAQWISKYHLYATSGSTEYNSGRVPAGLAILGKKRMGSISSLRDWSKPKRLYKPKCASSLNF